jgi:CHAD domain-containing protein
LTAREVIEARERFKKADIPNERSFKLIRPGLRFCYGRGRRAMSKAYQKQEETAFHEWRKRVKDLGYQMQILRELWPPVLKKLRTELDALGDLLGKEHDLIVLGETISKQADDQVRREDLQGFLKLTKNRKLKLQAQARAAGQRLYAEKPGGSSCGG